MPSSLRQRLVFLLALLAVLGVGRAARAAGYPCSEAGLDAALAAGGDATFNCAAPATIVVTQTKTITKSGTNLEGGSRFILSGGDTVVPLAVAAGVTASIARFTITDGNGPGDRGGNLVVDGTLTMTESTSQNGASFGGGSGVLVDPGGTLTMIRSLVSGSRAVRGGADTEGSVAVLGTATIIGSTLTGAYTHAIGARFGGSVTLVGSTVVTTSGEALRVFDASSSMNVSSSILATAPVYGAAASNGTLVSGGYNMLAVNTSPANQLALSTDIIGVQPILGALADNGGPTQTRALLACSPGINAGPTTSTQTTDQRGQARVQNAASDIGAYESGLRPCVQATDVFVAEGNAGTTAFTFTATLSGRSTLAASVDYATANGTATTADNDYIAAAGTISFAPGQLSRTVTVLGNGDARNEASETFALNLSGASNASIADAQALATILNDDFMPSINIGNVSVAEGDVGTTLATFTVTLSAASGQTVTVGFYTLDQTAKAIADYVATADTLTFPPGTTTQAITVMVNGDLIHEGDETFRVNLSGVTNAVIVNGSATCTILDNEATPGLVVGSASATEGNEGETPVALTVVLGTASSTPITVDWATVDGTATAAAGDYTTASGTLTFSPGETSKRITVTLLGDTAIEPDETFTVRLSNATSAEISTADGTVTITDDDLATPVISDAGAELPVDASTPSSPDASIPAFDGGTLVIEGGSDGDSGCAVAALGSGDASPMLATAAAGLALVLAARRRRRR